MNVKVILLASSLACAGALEVKSEELAVCGESAGYGYYPGVGLRAGKKPEWIEDGITGGRLTLNRAANGNFDILFADASGAVISSVADGGRVIRVGQTSDLIAILVVYDVSIETYTFLKVASGGEVFWTQNKHSAPVVKGTILRAPCSFVSLPVD